MARSASDYDASFAKIAASIPRGGGGSSSNSSSSSISGGSSYYGGDSDDGTIYISQRDYDAQKSMLSDPTFGGSFGARDIRNGNVRVGEYSDNTPYTNPITGASSIGGGHYVYSDPANPGVTHMVSGRDRQDYLAVARNTGFGDISSRFTPADLPTFHNAQRLGAGDYAYDFATGRIPLTQLPSLVPEPRPVMVAGVDTQPWAGTYDKDFYKTYNSLLPEYGYDADKFSRTGEIPFSPYGLTGYAAEYMYGRNQGGLGDAEAHEMARAGTSGIFEGLPSWYDPDKPGEAVVSAKELLPDPELDAKIRSAGVDPALLNIYEKAELRRILQKADWRLALAWQ